MNEFNKIEMCGMIMSDPVLIEDKTSANAAPAPGSGLSHGLFSVDIQTKGLAFSMRFRSDIIDPDTLDIGLMITVRGSFVDIDGLEGLVIYPTFAVVEVVAP